MEIYLIAALAVVWVLGWWWCYCMMITLCLMKPFSLACRISVLPIWPLLVLIGIFMGIRRKANASG